MFCGLCLKMTGIFIFWKQYITFVCASTPLGIIKKRCWYILYNQNTTGLLTHLPLVPHIGVSELDQHWFK